MIASSGNKDDDEKKEKEKMKKSNTLSSKSALCFLVNFQTKNAMTPRMATPPATDKPMMEPVPSPESDGDDDDDCEDGGGVEEFGADEPVKVTVTSEPLILVTLTVVLLLDGIGTGGVVIFGAETTGLDGEDGFEESELFVGVVVVLLVGTVMFGDGTGVGVTLSVLVLVTLTTWRRSMDADAEATKENKKREQKT